MGIGLLSIVVAAMDWDWLMDSRRAQRLVSLIGRGGARILYIVFGCLLVALANVITLH
ncbi:MAG TPA: immunity 17 family protein [Phototrophicaceae bacterium]|jgi:hypothetical protein|nr:immunity 17 family protein [Phototrophicaceae bacterium]